MPAPIRFPHPFRRASRQFLLTTAVAVAVATGVGRTQVRFAPLASPRALPPRADLSYGVVTGDFDGDGLPDVMFANWGPNALYRNLGNGRFEDVTATNLPANGAHSAVVATGDVDGDGDLDLFVGNADQPNQLLLNDGSGVFTDATPPAMAGYSDDTCAVLVGDVDGDGDLDLVVGNRGDISYFAGLYNGQNRLYLNDGTGQFTEASATHMLMPPALTESLLMLDVDGDGDPDLVELGGEVFLSSPYGGTTAIRSSSLVHLNDGNGVFTPAFGRMPIWTFRSATAFDPDQDGDLDLLLVDASEQPSFYRNDGAGYFQDMTVGSMPYAAGVSYCTGVVTPDLDGDGDADVLVGTLGGAELAFENLGNGIFWWMPQSVTGDLVTRTRAMASSDVDGDGHPDLLMANSAGPNLLLRWNGVDRFEDPDAVGGGQWFSKAFGSTSDAALVDLDGDGLRDLLLLDVAEPAIVLTHTADGFQRTPDREPVLQLPDLRVFATGDLDGNGHPDAVFGSSGLLATCLNDGTGRLVFTGTVAVPPSAPGAVRLGDLNGDGAMDAVVVTLNSGAHVLMGNGAGGFGSSAALPSTGYYGGRDVTLVDIDGDGDLDVVSCRYNFGGHVLRNDGSGNFTDVTSTALSSNLVSPPSVDAADVDGDGDMDLLFCDEPTLQTQAQVLYLNSGAGVFTRAPAGQLPAHGLTASQRLKKVRFRDFDGDGDADVVGNYSAPTSAGVLLDGGIVLFENQGNGVYQNVSAALAGVPMEVTAVLCDDVDQDGDPDLLAFGSPESVLYFGLARHLDVAEVVRPGGALELDAYARGVPLASGALMLPWLALAPASVSLPPFGHLGIDPSTAVGLPWIPIASTTGDGSIALAIPNQPSLVGAEIYTQGILLNPPDVPSFTNASRRVVVQ